jgi:hypothetical protein
MAIKRSTEEKWEEVGNSCMTFLLTTALIMPLRAGLLMLGFGAVHHEISSEVPAIGFWPSFALSAAWVAVVIRNPTVKGND